MKNKTKDSNPYKPRVLLWTDLSYSDVEEIDEAESTTDMERILSRALKIDFPQPRLGILLELYTNTVKFSKEQQFSREQTLVLLLIVRNMHQMNTETPINNIDQCFAYCSELLLCHSINRPPFSICLFRLEQVINILKHLTNTYMRHYVLYKYIFTPQMYLDLSIFYVGMPEEPIAEEPTNSVSATESENEAEKEADEPNEQGEEASAEFSLSASDAPKEEPSPMEDLRTIVQKEAKEEGMQLTVELEKKLQERNNHLSLLNWRIKFCLRNESWESYKTQL